nr:AzlD domain-containing protein [Corynebacterium lemuris]
MPEGVTLAQVLGVLLPVAVLTVVLRQLPFSALKMLRTNHLVGALGTTMPIGVMTVLVIYTLVSQVEAPGGLPASLLAVGVTVILHWWRRSAGLSIVGGTLAYMFLVNMVF